MEYFYIFLLLLVCLVLITRPLTVLLHELGHAIPAILLTRQKVTIYIGSYGDPANSIRLNLKVLEIYFRYNPFLWKLGLCVPSAKNISVNQNIIYTVTGPITSLMIATVACYFTFTYDLHGFLKLFLIVFFGSALIDLFMNLFPDSTPVKLHNGTISYNDGYMLKQLLIYKRLPKGLVEAIDLYHQERYSEAALLLEKLLADGSKDKAVYSLAIASYLQDKSYQKANDLAEELALTGKMADEDLYNMAISYLHLELHEKAIELYDRLLQKDPGNHYALNDKGYTLTLMNRFEESIPFFDKAIELDAHFSYAYNNRGLSKIKSGQMDQGLQDINRSFELDKDNAYAYRNLGIYHFEKGDYIQALELFLKGKELDGTTHLIDELIRDAGLAIEKENPIR